MPRRIARLTPPRTARRKGVATIWFVASTPVLLVVLLAVAELGHLWTARTELETAVDAAAIAAAQRWGDPPSLPVAGWTSAARLRGQQIAAANSIDGAAVVVGANQGGYNLITNPNENAAYTSGVGMVFGRATVVGSNVTFDADVLPVPVPLTTFYAVRVEQQATIPSLFGSMFGAGLASSEVAVSSTAIYDIFTNEARIVRVDTYNHP